MESEKMYKRIMSLAAEKGWTVYQLSKIADVSHSTLYNWHRRDTVPTVRVLSKLCDALEITMSQLFKESEDESMNEETARLVSDWQKLSPQQRIKLREYMELLRHERD